MSYKRAGFLRPARFCFRHRNRVAGTDRRCWSSWPDLGERWPSRLVATAAENRLSISPSFNIGPESETVGPAFPVIGHGGGVLSYLSFLFNIQANRALFREKLVIEQL